METTATKDDVAPRPKTGAILRIVLGILFLLPSLCCCASQLLVPTLSTFWMSLQKVEPFRDFGGKFVGVENYLHLFGDKGFQSAVGFTLSLLVVNLLVVAVAPFALAWAAGQLGRSLRWGARVLFSLPVAFFVPVAIACVWGMVSNPYSGLPPFNTFSLAKPDSAVSTLLSIDALYLLGLSGGLGLMAYLPLWRRPAGVATPTMKETLKPALAVWGFSLLATLAFTLSAFTLSYVLTAGGPLYRTSTLGILLYRSAFVNMQFGLAASIATLILLAMLALGMVAGLLVLLMGLRLNLAADLSRSSKTDGDMATPRSSALRWVAPALLLLLASGACLVGALPFGWLIPQSFSADGLKRLFDLVGVENFVNSFIPPLIAATLQLSIAYLAALSLGALQPLGRRSVWLLLLFSPWLFITVLPLSLDKFTFVQKAGLINNFFGLVSPVLFSVPVLFILTLFFKGRTAQLQQDSVDVDAQPLSYFLKNIVLPSLPLAALLWLFLLFIGWQDVFWPLLVSHGSGAPLGVVLLQIKTAMATNSAGALAAVLTLFIFPVCFFFFIALALFQVFYLDRLMIYSDDLPAH